jgi:adenylate kinase
MRVIFLAGVHGVGKGFLGAPVANELGICHLTASQLIREEKGHASWSSDKRTSEPDDNQLALIRAVAKRRLGNQDLLLDGHFVLRDVSGKIIRLAQEVFSKLQLSSVILLTEDADTISQRLNERDGKAMNTVAIEELNAEEARHAQEICCELNLPLSILHKPTVRILVDSVSRCLNR